MEPEETCGICLENMATLPRGQLDCCNHAFCVDCISKQFQYDQRCPLCRRKFVRINGQCPKRINIPLSPVVPEESFSGDWVPLAMLTRAESEERERALYWESKDRPRRVLRTDKMPENGQCYNGVVSYTKTTTFFLRVPEYEDQSVSFFPPPQQPSIVAQFCNKCGLRHKA